MNNLELKYEDYESEVIFSKELDDEGKKQVGRLYDMLMEYSHKTQSTDNTQGINIGYSHDIGFYTYSKIDNDNYQIMKLGNDIQNVFLKLVIYNIEYKKAVDAEHYNKERCILDFQKRFRDLDYSSCIYYAEFIIGKLKKYYDGRLPKNVVDYFENYLFKTTCKEWSYDGDKFNLVENKKRVRSFFKKTRKA